jgi:hypothetical protein
LRVHWDVNPEETMFFHAGKAANGAKLVLDAAGQSVEISATNQIVTVGRSSGDIVLPDKMVSRQHAVIRYAGGRFILMDQSTNGTFIQYDTGQHIQVRREAVDIVGSGVIGFGNPPAVEETAVRFRCG